MIPPHPVDPRQLQVQQNHRRIDVLQRFHGPGAIPLNSHRVAMAGQIVAHQLGQAIVVLDQKNA